MAPILLRVMWQHIRRRPTQSILFIVGVMIGVAMMVAIDIANNSAKKAFELSTESVVGKATHQITGGTRGLDEAVYTQIRRDIGWQQSAPVVTGFVIVEELDEQPLNLFGIDPFTEQPFRNYVTASGDLDVGSDDEEAELIALGRFLVEPNTVLMGETLADRYGVQPGDSLSLLYGDKVSIVTVIGLLRTSDQLTEQALQSLLIADISTAQEVFDQEGRLSRIDLIVDENSTAGQAVLADIEGILPVGANLSTSAARSNAVGQLTEAFELNLMAMSLLALVVGMFLVYNTVTFSVVQRRTVLGILRSLGVTRRQIFALIWGEAAILSAIGASLGLVLGIIFGRFTVSMVTQTINDAFFTLSVQTIAISPLVLIKGLGVGVGAALMAALLPAYEATHTTPASVIRRSELEQKTLKLIPIITTAGIVIIIIGILFLRIQALAFNFAGIFALVIGMAFLTALVTILAVQLMRPITGQLGGVVGRMAPRSILRNLSRTSVSIAALMLAVSVIVGVTAMVGSFRITVEDWLGETLRADIFISPPNTSGSLANIPISRDLIPEVEAIEGIKRVIYVRTVFVQQPNDNRPIILNAVMSDISEGRRNITKGIEGSNEEILNMLLESDAMLMTESFANNWDIEWYDGLTMTLMTEQGPHDFPVLGIYQDFSSSQGSVLIGLDTYQHLWQDDGISSLAAYVKDGIEIDSVVEHLQSELAGRKLLVQSNRELRKRALDIFDRTFAITSALNLLATLVAFIGILSALMALQIERQREIGIMRSSGLTRGQLLKLTLWETGIMGTIAGTLAMPVGLVLAIVLTYIINLRSFGWSLSLSLRWEFFAQAFVVALVAALLAGIYPAWKAGRIQPVEAIRSE